MKHQLVKTTALSALCLAAAGFSGISWGHDVTGNLAVTNVRNVDVYHVTCFDDGTGVPNRFVGAVTRTSGTNSLRISISSVFAPAVGPLPKDTVGAAKTAYAQITTGVFDGSEHIAVIGHSTAQSNNYTASLHCEDSTAGGINNPAADRGTLIWGGTPFGGGVAIINQ